jgi:uncharacterized protein (DUF302 family)
MTHNRIRQVELENCMAWKLRFRCRVAVATLVAALAALAGCGADEPVAPARYAAIDRLYDQLRAGVEASPDLDYVVNIDHSRLAGEQGVVMPPSHVLIASAPKLEAEMFAHKPLLALDLPLRALAYEAPDEQAAVTYNRWAYIAARHGVDEVPQLAEAYRAAMEKIVNKVPPSSIRHFETDRMDTDGIITLDSEHDFETTVERTRAAINSQGDTVWFGEIDFQAQAAEFGIAVSPGRLLLFGAPGPGGKVMAAAPTLGLDAFCPKLLIWQGADGRVRVSFNDLLALAERQGVGLNIPLRVVDSRLSSTFEAATGPD